MRTIYKHIIYFFAIAALSACTTTGKRNDLASNSKLQDPIVGQSGSSNFVISKIKRKHWIQIRKSTKNPSKKLYATLAAGAWDAAEIEARNHLQKHPKDEGALTALIIASSMQRKHPLAAYYAGLLEKYHQPSAESLNARGLAAVTAPKASIEDFQKAVQLFHQSFYSTTTEIAAGLNLGRLYLELGDAQGASEIFAEARKRCNDCLPSLIGNGVANSRLRNLDRARTAFKLVLKVDPYHPQALYRLALISKEDRKLEQAKRYLDLLMVHSKSKDYVITKKAEELVRTLDSQSDVSNIAFDDSDLKDTTKDNKQDDPLIKVNSEP